MATRLYFPASGTAPVSPAISSSDWNAHINVQRLPLNAVQGSTAINTLNYTPDAADHLVAGASHFAQFVSDVLPPQTVQAQTVKLQVRASEANANNNLGVAWKIFAVSEDGQTVLGTLLALRVDATEVATTLTNRSDSATTNSFTATQNFRLVVELGMSGTPAATSGVQGHNGSFSFGEDAAADLPEDDASTTASNPWIQFARPFKIGVGNNLSLVGHECGGGGHVDVDIQVNSGQVYHFVYETPQLVEAIPEELIRDTALGIMRLHGIGKTAAQNKADVVAGLKLVL